MFRANALDRACGSVALCVTATVLHIWQFHFAEKVSFWSQMMAKAADWDDKQRKLSPRKEEVERGEMAEWSAGERCDKSVNENRIRVFTYAIGRQHA
jgi:hypothetical protein